MLPAKQLWISEILRRLGLVLFPPGNGEGGGTEASMLTLQHQMIPLHQTDISWLAMLSSGPTSTSGSAKPQRFWA